MLETPRPVPPRSFDEPSARVHRRRPLPVRPVHVHVDVTLDPGGEPVVAGRVTHTVEARRSDVARFTVDAADMESVRIVNPEGRARVSPHAGGVDLHVDPPLALGETFTFTLEFQARPQLGLYFVHPRTHGADVRPQVWTQGAMEDHHHWFPCFDAPEHMVTSEVTARVPAGYVALSNGEPVAFAEPDADARHRFHWRHAHPHALYLLTLVVDRLVEVVDDSGPVPCHHWVPEGREADARVLFERMPEMLRWFGESTGLAYPYPRYGHVFLQDFMWGGMENTTLTSLTDAVLVDGEHRDEEDVERLFAHELAHQWFGDLIAPRGWAEIWLNESFATYFEQLCMGALADEGELARRMQGERDSYLGEASGRYQRAVVTHHYAHPYVLFDRHAYEKGCLVLHTLRDQLGEDAWWRGLRAYVRAHAGRAAETAELRRCFEDATGEDLGDFFDHFVFGAGHPSVEVSWRHDPRTGLTFTVRRTDDGPHRLIVTLGWADAEGTAGEARVPVEPGERVCVVPGVPAPVWVALDPAQHCLLVVDESQETDAALIARLRGPAATVAPIPLRIRTVRTLASRGRPANTRALVAVLLNDPAEAVRLEAAKALGEHRDEAARGALERVLASDVGWRVRQAAGRALGVGAPDGVEDTLRRLLDAERSHRVRCGLVGALGEIRTVGARALLRAELGTPSPRHCVARAALAALGRQEEPGVLPDLVEHAGSGHPKDVRTAALSAIADLATTKSPAITPELKARSRKILEAALTDRVFGVRAAAARGLQKLADPQSEAALKRAHGAEVFALLRRVMREALGAVDAAKTSGAAS